MDISKAIKWVSGVMDGNGQEPTKNKKEVIECLRQCEAYKAIVEEIGKIFSKEDGNILTEHTFNIIKQKYFHQYAEEIYSEALSQNINRFSKSLREMAFTCEEIAKRFIPKD